MIPLVWLCLRHWRTYLPFSLPGNVTVARGPPADSAAIRISTRPPNGGSAPTQRQPGTSHGPAAPNMRQNVAGRRGCDNAPHVPATRRRGSLRLSACAGR